MKKAAGWSVLILGLILCVSTACRKGGETGRTADKYAEVKEVLTKYVSLLETCAGEVKGASEAAGIAAALNKMNDGLQPIALKIKTLSRDYPELNDPANVAADLKPFMERLDAVQPVFKAAIEKADAFASDPFVQLALGRFAEMQRLMD